MILLLYENVYTGKSNVSQFQKSHEKLLMNMEIKIHAYIDVQLKLRFNPLVITTMY